MDTYVFANQKGGVGKTTITLGIAAALARRGARVLLVDLDPQGSATKVLGIAAEERCTMADELLEPERYQLQDTIVPTEWGFDVAPAEIGLGLAGVASSDGGRVSALPAARGGRGLRR